jgi:hypothetical protein
MSLKVLRSSVVITLPFSGLRLDSSGVIDLLSLSEWTLDQISFE